MDVNRAAEIAYNNGYKLGLEVKNGEQTAQFIRGFLKATEDVDLTEKRYLDLRKQTLEHLKEADLSTTDKECIRAIFRLVEKREAEIEDLEYRLIGIMHFIDKFLDGDELEQDEVVRAEIMRDKVLSLLEDRK